MKILTILLILLQINTFGYGNYSSPYSSNYNSYSSESYRENRYRGIGYSTNYSNGQFNSGIYKSSMTTIEYQNRIFTGTYTPASGNSGGSRHPGQPRKVKGYVENDEDGYDYKGDNSSEEQKSKVFWIFDWDTWNFCDDEDDYNYYWDGTSWWRQPKDGGVWESWKQNSGGFSGSYWSWTSGGSPEKGYHRGYHENPTPIGDSTVPLLILLFLYIGYDIFKKNHNKL